MAPNLEGTALRARVQAFVRGFGLLDDASTPCGLPLPTSHAHALMVLQERTSGAGACRQKDLAGALGLDKGSVTRLCRRMEESGHVVQSRSPDDGRSRVIELTAQGERLALAVDRASREQFGRVLAAIPKGERASVLDALDVLNAAIATLEDLAP